MMKLRIADCRLRIGRALILTACAVNSCFAQQCYIDPITGRRYCLPNPQSEIRIPQFENPQSLNPQPSTLNTSAHCRVIVGDGTTGSGTLVARGEAAGLVLTCAHLFDGAAANIAVTFTNGQRYAATIVERDRANDLAALLIRRPDVEPVAVCDSPAADPAVLTACGFGPNGQFGCVRGSAAGRATAAGATHPSLVLRGAVRPGDSGGAVLNASGQLVGVVWGQRDGATYATCLRPILALLDRIAGMGGRGSRRAIPGDGSPGGSPSRDWNQWASGVDARIRALEDTKQDKGDYLRRGDLPDPSDRIESITSRIESVHERVEHVAQIAQQSGGILHGLSLGKLLAGAVGLSGPPAVAIVLATSLLRVAASRRSQRSAPGRGRAIAVDTPPPPQQTVRETHYVPYEQDLFAKAHQWACEQVVRKYPGSTEVLHTQDSLIKQYLAAGK
jgi:hypothetical protein